MQIWKLSAKSPSDPRWRNQDFAGPIIIRAVGEYEARQIAQLKTSQFHRVSERDRFQSSPWIDPDTTSCETLVDSEFLTDGEPSMLSPIHEHLR